MCKFTLLFAAAYGLQALGEHAMSTSATAPFVGKRVSVIGAGSCNAATAQAARDLGAGVAGMGAAVVCGGLGGVMEAACQGAQEAGGATIGILPGTDRNEANAFVQTAIATGLGPMRNYLVVLNGDVVVAVEGETGTLSELALAQKTAKTVIALGRWNTIPGVIPAQDVPQALELLREILAS